MTGSVPPFAVISGAQVQQALAGQEITTVHELDNGDMIQAMVPVRDGDTEATLAARVLEAEHRIYPQALRLVAEGRVTLAVATAATRG